MVHQCDLHLGGQPGQPALLEGNGSLRLTNVACGPKAHVLSPGPSVVMDGSRDTTCEARSASAVHPCMVPVTPVARSAGAARAGISNPRDSGSGSV
ncbi:hypothetical protein NL676_023318 [Syzygium grande]|nr:hypothetical protein NL676_023318 [Syzygium grande]